MDILFLTNYFPPESNAPAIRTFEHAKRWVQKGHTVRVICACPNHPTGKPFSSYKNGFFKKETIEGIEVIRVWSFLAANKGRVRRICSYISFGASAALSGLFLKKPDILIATSPQFFCGIGGALLHHFKNIPFILEIRDIWPESIQAVNAVRSSWLLRLLTKLEHWMYRASNRIVTVGEGYKRLLAAKSISEDSIKVIPNGIDFELFKPSEYSHRAHFNIPHDKFVLAYVGTVGMAHDVDIMRRAALLAHERGLGQLHMLIVGDGALRKALEEAIKKDGLGNIQLIRQVPREEIPELLSSIDASLVHLRKTELFTTVLPSKLFEPMATKKPIILGVKGEAERICKEADAGIMIEPENEQELLSALLELQKDKRRSDQLGENGYQYVHKYYDRETFASQYLEVMQQVINHA